VETRILKEATRHFAKRKPANLVWGVGVDQHSDCVDTIHCLIALITITGNIGIPGGMVFSLEPFGVKRRGDAVEDFPEVKLQAIGLKEYPLMGIGNPYGQPDILLEQMGADEPYPIKGAWIQGAGIIPSGFADPHRVWRLFKKLDFIVIVDIFLNPASVALADIIFPAAMFPEKDSIYVHYSQLGAINKAIEPLGESKSDAEIILLIGKKIAPKYFPWNNVIEWLDYRLKPAGMNFAELREIGSLIPKIRFQNENVDLRTENLHGFRTHSGKIEIYSTLLEKFGLSPLPRFRPDAYRIPEEAREKYPFILTTGARKPYFFCAEHRQSATARRFQPQPEVFINSAVASKLKINNGDKVKIFSPFGSCIMTAKITERFIPEVIHCDSGWWFPEREGREPELFGVDECNVNALFPSGLQGESGFGYPFKSYFCNVEKIGI
jgi:anaerobic selenocysteine-containing dehydrogenase